MTTERVTQFATLVEKYANASGVAYVSYDEYEEVIDWYRALGYVVPPSNAKYMEFGLRNVVIFGRTLVVAR